MSQALQKAMRKGALKTRPEVCHRKQKYDSLKIARRRSDERGLYPYHCNNCGKWHLSKLRSNKPAYDPFASQSKPQVTLQYQLQHRKRKGDGTLAPASVNRIMSTLSKLFSLACEEGLLDRNPMQYVKSLKEPPPRSRLLTAEEKERLWKELAKDDLMSRLVTLALHLPLRRGQLLAITKDAIDLPNGILLTISSKGREQRVIPLNSTAIATLRLMMMAGQLPFPLKDFRRRWNKITQAAGINQKNGKRGTNFTFHDLRKEFASELLRRNVNPNIVQKLFAHSDMSITNVYLHADQNELAKAVNILDSEVIE